ncbi:MAG TPA: ferritin family protein [Syntrophomonadaceae bacterium]|nr:ferritin family protein [Syntrophomonadaceae bacterium]
MGEEMQRLPEGVLVMYEKELEILKTAIVNEQEGYQFYLMAAEKTEDPVLRGVFNGLAAEEESHESWLRTTYRDIMEKGKPGAMLIDEFTMSPEIFTLDKLKEAGGIIIAALKVGVMMEKASMDFYRQAAARTEIEEVKQLLLTLGKWEMGHLDRLEDAYDFAREEWWEQQGFSES